MSELAPNMEVRLAEVLGGDVGIVLLQSHLVEQGRHKHTWWWVRGDFGLIVVPEDLLTPIAPVIPEEPPLGAWVLVDPRGNSGDYRGTQAWQHAAEGPVQAWMRSGRGSVASWDELVALDKRNNPKRMAPREETRAACYDEAAATVISGLNVYIQSLDPTGSSAEPNAASFARYIERVLTKTADLIRQGQA